MNPNLSGAQFSHKATGAGGEVLAHVEGKRVGRLAYYYDTVEGQTHIGVGGVHVEPQHQGRGIAKALYDRAAQDNGMPFIHDPDNQTPQGYALATRLAALHPERHHWYAGDGKEGPRRTSEAPAYPFPDW